MTVFLPFVLQTLETASRLSCSWLFTNSVLVIRKKFLNLPKTLGLAERNQRLTNVGTF